MYRLYRYTETYTVVDTSTSMIDFAFSVDSSQLVKLIKNVRPEREQGEFGKSRVVPFEN